MPPVYVAYVGTAGELECSITHAFVRGSNLRRWLNRSDCPPALKECKILFEKVFRREPADSMDVADAEVLPEHKLPEDLQALVKAQMGRLQARYRADAVMYSRRSTHVGNSLVLFYPKGKRDSSYVPGTIKYIFSTEKNSTIMFACHRHLDSRSAFDPFAIYPDFPASLYSSSLSEALELVKVDWIYSHFALYQVSTDDVVVLPLSRE